MFGTKDGVPDGFIHVIVTDSRGRLWIGGKPGGRKKRTKEGE